MMSQMVACSIPDAFDLYIANFSNAVSNPAFSNSYYTGSIPASTFLFARKSHFLDHLPSQAPGHSPLQHFHIAEIV
jgi:hypothetical protein